MSRNKCDPDQNAVVSSSPDQALKAFFTRGVLPAEAASCSSGALDLTDRTCAPSFCDENALTSFGGCGNPDPYPFNLVQVGGSPVTLGANVSAMSIPVVLPTDYVLPISLPAGFATSALQVAGNTTLTAIDTILNTLNAKFVSGNDIGDVTVNNGGGAGAVNIQDGGNSITVDGTVTANQGTSPWVVSGTLAVTQSTSPWITNQSQWNGNAVDLGNGTVGSGTLRVTIANDSTGQVKLATGANTIGALTANQSVNATQWNGNTVNLGNGTVGTGTLRVTLASDSTGQVALASFPARSALTIPAEGILAGKSLTGAYQNLLVMGGDAKGCVVTSSCDKQIIISLDSGTTASIVLEPYEIREVPVPLDSKISSATIQVKHAGVVPNVGYAKAFIVR